MAAGFEKPDVTGETIKQDDNVDQTYYFQKEMIAIKDFQNVAKIVDSLSGIAKMVNDGGLKCYNDSLNNLKVYFKDTKVVSDYINIGAAEKLGSLINELERVCSVISNYHYERDDSLPIESVSCNIVNKTVKVKVTEKIIPKFTTLEYN